MGGSSSSRSRFTSMFWRLSCWPMIPKTSLTGPLMSILSLANSAFRPNSLRRFMIDAALSTWFLTSLATRRRVSSGISFLSSAIFFRKSFPSLIAFNGWFNSWAMPADIWPRLVILLAWINCVSLSIISVISVVATIMASLSPYLVGQQ